METAAARPVFSWTSASPSADKEVVKRRCLNSSIHPHFIDALLAVKQAEQAF
jgi:hypothetical protein